MVLHPITSLVAKPITSMNGIDPNPGLSQKLCYGTRRRVQIPLTSDQAATDPVCVCGCPVSRDGPRWTYIEQVSNRISHSKTAAHNASIIRRSNRTVSYVNTSNVIRQNTLPSPLPACMSVILSIRRLLSSGTIEPNCCHSPAAA